jgi:hypothetical protein
MNELLRIQQGVIATRQMTKTQRVQAKRLVRAESWREITPKTFLASPASPTLEQLAWAAVLHCGEGAALGGHNALVLHGWNDKLQKPFDVVYPTRVRDRPQWLRLRRVHCEIGSLGSPPRVNAHDALLQAVAWARSEREALCIELSALQQRLVSPQRLIELVDVRPRMKRRAVFLEALDDFRGGAQSLNELDLGRVCSSNGIPGPVRQVRVYDAYGTLRAIDAEFTTPSGPVHVEVEGLQHLDPLVWFSDLRRHNGLVLNGQGGYLRYSSWTINHDPEEFLRDMRLLCGGDSAGSGSMIQAEPKPA